MTKRLTFLLHLLSLRALCIGLFVFVYAGKVHAYETDQYTVPPSKLQDVGPALSKLIAEALDQTVRDFQALSYKPSEKEFLTRFRARFSKSITWQEQRDAVFGADLTLFGELEDERNGAILFDPGKTKNIYSFAGFHRIISPTYFVFSSTMNAYDVYFGVDKLGHFFNQGFQYWEQYLEHKEQGHTELRAEAKVIGWGATMESGFFGRIVDGVYSNADLAANYAGFKFYQNIFKDLELSSGSLPALLMIDPGTGLYKLNSSAMASAEEVLKPFITEHFNEALNPSVLERPMRVVVRKAMTSRCDYWKQFNQHLSQQDVTSIEVELLRWNGLNYGNEKENRLLLSEICY